MLLALRGSYKGAVSRNNPDLDAQLKAEGWWKAKDIATITGLSDTVIRRAGEKWRQRKIDPTGEGRLKWVWTYYHIDSVLVWLGPEVAPKLAPKFGVGVERAQKLTEGLKGQPRRRGRPSAVQRLGPPLPAPEPEPKPISDVIIEPGSRPVRRVSR